MHFFKKKVIVSESIEIPGWEQTPYDIVAAKWSQNGGLNEPWDKCLQDAEPADVVACLQKVAVQKGAELGAAGRRGWILLSAYRKQREGRIRLLSKVQELEGQINVLNEKLEKLKVCDEKVTAMSVINEQIVAENKDLNMQDEQLMGKLGKAELIVSSVIVSSQCIEGEIRDASVLCDDTASVCSVKASDVICSDKSAESPNRKRRTVTCFSCLRLGHIAKYCQKRERKVKCFACGSLGHIARSCPVQKERHVRKCYLCSEAGHIARYCLSIKSEVSGVKAKEKCGPKIAGKVKEVYSSMWKFRRWQSRHSHRNPCQPQSDKNGSVEEESPHVNLG